MFVVKLIVGGVRITWIINDNWIMLISFLLTIITGITYRKIKNLNKKIKISNPKGGAFIDESIEPDSIYELVDRPLEIVFKQMLNLPPEADPVIISVPVLISAYLISRQPIKLATILGVSFFVDKFQSLVVKVGIGVVNGSIFFFIPVGLGSLTGASLGAAIIFNVAQGIGSLECDNLVSKTTMKRVSQEQTIDFLEPFSGKTPKVFIKGSNDIELYIPSRTDNGSSSLEYKEVVVKN
jgi:hypothetical protein